MNSHLLGGNSMDQLGHDFAIFLFHLLNPTTFGLVVSLGTLGWQLYKRIKKMVHENYHESIQPLENKIDKLNDSIAKLRDDEKHEWTGHLVITRDIQKEVLRLQILEGIDARRLSESEVRYFYDKYKAYGGNSFVTSKVKKYLEQLEQEKLSEEKDDDK